MQFSVCMHLEPGMNFWLLLWMNLVIDLFWLSLHYFKLKKAFLSVWISFTTQASLWIFCWLVIMSIYAEKCDSFLQILWRNSQKRHDFADVDWTFLSSKMHFCLKTMLLFFFDERTGWFWKGNFRFLWLYF